MGASERKTAQEVVRVRHHKGFGHGLRPGCDSDMNCLSCKREQKEGRRPVITAGPVPPENLQRVS